MSLIFFDHVSKAYFGQTILNSISFSLDAGERLCLIGNNGTGKTTLLSLIMGLEKTDSGRITIAEQAILGYLPQTLPEGESLSQESWLSPEILELEQKLEELERGIAALAAKGVPEQQIKRKLGQYTALAAEYEARGGPDHRHKMKEIMGGLGLGEDITRRDLSTMSGGEQKRVALARIIIKNPDIILLDEPTNHLDLSALEWLEQYLVSFKGTVLFTSHDRTFIDRTATSVGRLAAGSLKIYSGGYTRLIEQEADERLNRERTIKKTAAELKRQQQIVQTMLSHRNISAYRERKKIVSQLSDKLDAARRENTSNNAHLQFNISAGQLTGDTKRVLLKAENVSGGFAQRLLFKDVSFELRANEKLCICGPNGCGKTTLLNLLRGVKEALSGRVLLKTKKKVGYLSQIVSFNDEQQTVLAELLKHSDLSIGQARDLLANYGFRDVNVEKRLATLSGGERSRLYLACLMTQNPHIIFLDEPTNQLDIQSREILEDALKAYKGAVLAVSHDRTFIERCCDRVLGFTDREVKIFDSYSAYRQAQKVAEPVPLEQIRPVRSDRNQKRRNRAQIRKEQAYLKMKKAELENSIHELEEKKEALESVFDEMTGPQAYQEFADLLAEIESLYEQYFALETDEIPD